MKIDQAWITGHKTELILGGILLAVLIVFIYLSWPAKKPVDTQAILNAGQAVLVKQYLNQIDEQGKEIEDKKSQLKVSEEKNALLVQKINSLKKEKDNVKAPVSNKEIRDRFIAAGFPPLPVK